jgi:hypothetical protein
MHKIAFGTAWHPEQGPQNDLDLELYQASCISPQCRRAFPRPDSRENGLPRILAHRGLLVENVSSGLVACSVGREEDSRLDGQILRMLRVFKRCVHFEISMRVSQRYGGEFYWQ